MKRIGNLAILIIALAAAAMGQSPAQTQPQPGTLLTEAPSAASDAPIGPRDVIEVKVFQDPSLNTKMTVTDDGRITMPLLGKVDVSGLTPTELETRIKKMLEASYINKADVSVTVLE